MRQTRGTLLQMQFCRSRWVTDQSGHAEGPHPLASAERPLESLKITTGSTSSFHATTLVENHKQFMFVAEKKNTDEQKGSGSGVEPGIHGENPLFSEGDPPSGQPNAETLGASFPDCLLSSALLYLPSPVKGGPGRPACEPRGPPSPRAPPSRVPPGPLPVDSGAPIGTQPLIRGRDSSQTCLSEAQLPSCSLLLGRKHKLNVS